MKTNSKLFYMIATTVLIGCTEKPVRLVIDPPVSGTAASQSQKISYQIDNKATGTQEKIDIPVAQIPRQVVIDQPANSNKTSVPTATLADKKFANGEETPSVSYLKGVEGAEQLYKEKKFQDALIQLAPLIEAYPTQPKLHIMQGTIYKRLGENRLAYKSYKKALELDKDNLRVQEALDKLQLQIGEVKG